MSKFFLNELKIGVNAVIKGCSRFCNLKIKRRLLELGFVQGEKVCLEEVSMLGEVMLFSIRGYLISLRKDVAKYIEVMG